jgi:hypothetical protein
MFSIVDDHPPCGTIITTTVFGDLILAQATRQVQAKAGRRFLWDSEVPYRQRRFRLEADNLEWILPKEKNADGEKKERLGFAQQRKNHR